jgi:hypothetical protein
MIAMSLFEHNYNGLVAYAKAIIKNHNLLIDSGDLINDAYIDLVASGRDYNRDEFKKLLSKRASEQVDGRTVRLGTFKKPSVTQEQICCKKCHEVKPVGAFEILKSRGFEYPRKTCKACVYERVKERRKIRPARSYYKAKAVPLALQLDKQRRRKKPEGYKSPSRTNEAVRSYFKSWLSRQGNRERFNSHVKDHAKKQREELTDTYIKLLLKRRGKEISETTINDTRLRLIYLRDKRKQIKRAA